MNISFYLKNTDKNNQDVLEKYLTDKKLNRLTRLLKHGNLEIADLRIRIENSPHRKRLFFINLTLNIGKKKLVAKEQGMNILEVFDLAFDCLVFQARKMEALRHDT